MAYSGLAGQFGDIPIDLLLKKNEITDLPLSEDDTETMHNHMRNLLVDHRPDRPFLESDQPRSSNIPGSGFMSEQMINLRTSGALTTEDPFLPDGLFLDWEFTERDPRSTSTDPDMTKYVDQERARGSFFRYSPDADYSVPERGINPVQMINNINSGFYPTKDRMQIFDESYDSWHNGGTVQRVKKGGDSGKTTQDGTLVDLAEASYSNRQDATTKLSNDPLMAYRHAVPDQRVKIARYGNNRISQSLKTQDWKNNRASAYVNQDIGQIVNNERVNSAIATAIINLEGIRDTKQAVFQGADYGDSAVLQTLQSLKIPVDAINKMLRVSAESNADPANMQFENAYIKTDAIRVQKDRKDHSKSDLNHYIAEIMTMVNRIGRDRTADDLREQIERSAADYGIYHEDGNRSRENKSDRRKQADKSEDERHIEGGKEVYNFGSIAPKKDKKMQNAAWEGFARHSMTAMHREHAKYGADMVQNIKSYENLPLYEERREVFAQSKGNMREKVNARNNYDLPEEAVNERDLAKHFL